MVYSLRTSHGAIICERTLAYRVGNYIYIYIYFRKKNLYLLLCWPLKTKRVINHWKKALFTDSQNSFKHRFKYKFRLHSTIHTFKNYFAIVFSVSNFHFSVISGIQINPQFLSTWHELILTRVYEGLFYMLLVLIYTLLVVTSRQLFYSIDTFIFTNYLFILILVGRSIKIARQL